MQSDIRLLDQIRIEEPCTAAWEEMTPVDGDRVRYCFHCQLNVHNLSEMSREEAEALLSSTEGRLCVQYAQRADGKILTNDFPRLREIRIVALKQWATAASVVAALSGLFLSGAPARGDEKPAPGAQKPAQEGYPPDYFKGKKTLTRGEVAIPVAKKSPDGKPGEKTIRFTIGRRLTSRPRSQEVKKSPAAQGKPIQKAPARKPTGTQSGSLPVDQTPNTRGEATVFTSLGLVTNRF
jgi:hypothetical protein